MKVEWILGIVDILAAAALGALVLGHPFSQLQAITAVALILKGSLFIKDILSILDVCIGIAIIVLLWVSSPVLALCLAVYLAFKGAYTFA